MSIIPLDFQRRYEQRWAARLTQPVLSTAPERHGPESQIEQLAVPVKDEEAGLKAQPAV
jgi:hypothetical protein